MAHDIKTLPVFETLKAAYVCIKKNEHTFRFFWLMNFILCAICNLIPDGFSNPKSLIWSVIYYVYWCIFFRFYYGKRPYFSASKIFSSAIPSSKMIFMTFALVFFLIILPYIPLVLGFHNRYLLFFEKYMSALQAPQTSLLNITIFSSIFLVISPVVFCKPYLAWISALQGLSGSIRKVFKKTKGNYISFLSLMFVLNLPCAAIYEIDAWLECQGWLSAGFYSIYLIYCNLIFAKVYDFFYREQES